MNHTAIVPFIKWAGGKRQLLDQIKERMPKQYNRYYEPFVGGGAVVFELQPEMAVINDINRALVNAYRQIRSLPEAFLSAVKALDGQMWEDGKAYYYMLRERYNDKLMKEEFDTELAALFVFINKHCFNGLYRVNQKGQFNVPWNQKEQVRSVDVENIKNISYYLKSVTITCQDFEASLETAKKGDFIYFDSPYAPLNPASFDSYTKEGFTEEEHRRLAKVFGELSERGCYCMLTNHNTELIQELYQDYLREEVDVRRAINSDPKKRVGKEVIIRNYGEAITGEE